MFARLARSFVAAAMLATFGANGTSAADPTNTQLPVTMNALWDAPDPGMLVASDTVWIYTTNAAYLGNVPAWQSTNTGFEYIGDALPQLGQWAVTGYTWAPGVAFIGNAYRLYYTATDELTGRQCLGLASAPTPSGPFRDASFEPLICQTNLGGSIDAQPFQDASGTWWLTWKSDGNAIGTRCALWTVRLGSDGQPSGQAAEVVTTSATHDHPIENPAMVYAAGTYHLFFSSGLWTSASYATFHTTCASPAGPCGAPNDNAVILADSHLVGTGGASLARTGDGSWLIAYHAYLPGATGLGQPRRTYIATLDFHGITPTRSAWLSAPPQGSGDCRIGPAPGSYDTDGHRYNAEVYRLYCAVFLRYPDHDGFAHWVYALERGFPLLSVATLFDESPEFSIRYGATTSQEFVTLLYNNTLRRDPDLPGLMYWTGLLDSGRLSRSEVLLGFSESLEFQLRTETSKL